MQTKFKHIFHKLCCFIDPRIEMKRCYKKVFGFYPNIEEPKNLIEKIYWLQLNSDTSLWTLCADKYKVREYISNLGLIDYMPALYGKWDNINDINFDELPKSFVLKTNNGCGSVIIVKDKSKINISSIKTKLANWMSAKFGYSGSQLHYLNIKPCIIAEELLEQDVYQKGISPNSIIDYKIWCINGKAESILIVYNRSSKSYNLDLYDIYWDKMENCLNMNGHFEYDERIIHKPECLSEMIEIAEKISKAFHEVRVDFYVVNKKPVIGELTFTTGYGYFTLDYYNYLGSKMINVPSKINKNNTI